jgi:superfamily II DNA helicase RecQ
MEEFADLLREIQSGSDDEHNSGKGKRSKKHSKKAAVSPAGDRMSTELLENQQLSFQLASDVRSLRQQLADEKQSKRLLAATNASLESQLSKMEQKHAAMEQALRLSEQKRFELQRQLDAEVSAAPLSPPVAPCGPSERRV